MLILASQSAARKSLLAGAGLKFESRPAQIEERAIEAAALTDRVDAQAIAQCLAEAKALAVPTGDAQDLVIGADQVLALDGELLHKPQNMEAAQRQLDRLRGRTHRLHTGIALARGETILWSHVETATLTMRDFSDSERDAVLALEGAGVLGAVGAYRLEGPSTRLFDSVEGDYFTILGLPLLPLLSALRLHAPHELEGFT